MSRRGLNVPVAAPRGRSLARLQARGSAPPPGLRSRAWTPAPGASARGSLARESPPRGRRSRSSGVRARSAQGALTESRTNRPVGPVGPSLPIGADSAPLRPLRSATTRTEGDPSRSEARPHVTRGVREGLERGMTNVTRVDMGPRTWLGLTVGEWVEEVSATVCWLAGAYLLFFLLAI